METIRGKRRWMIGLRFMACTLSAVLLGACAPGTGELPCDRGELVSPESLSPGGTPADEGEIIGTLTPTFSWTYPDPTCIPEYYRLILATSWHELDTSPAEFRIDGGSTEWIPEAELLPGTTYLWRVQAGSAWETVGGRLGIFRTGPSCDITSPARLQEPIPLWPENGSRVEGVNPTIEWDDPTECIADGHYVVEISESSSFEPTFVGSYVEPYLFVAAPWVDFELEDCTWYYWRVHFDHERRADDDDGPYSATWSFATGTSTEERCPPDLLGPYVPAPGVPLPPEPEGMISGYVWHDECMTPSWDTGVAPPGCEAAPYGGFEANGMLDPGESGIEGIIVRLGAGACPVDDGRSTTTDAAGFYSFDSLSPGAYCVSIDALQNGNEQVLIPGHWTSPERAYGPGPIEMELALSEHQMTDASFGWDYRFLPSETVPISTPEVTMGCWVWNANLQKDVCTSPCPPNPQPGGACTP